MSELRPVDLRFDADGQILSIGDRVLVVSPNRKLIFARIRQFFPSFISVEYLTEDGQSDIMILKSKEMYRTERQKDNL